MGKLIALVGGNGGIGLAAANQFVERGAYGFVTGCRQRELAAAVKEVGKNATGVQGDVEPCRSRLLLCSNQAGKGETRCPILVPRNTRR